jgi:hypothetical protein
VAVAVPKGELLVVWAETVGVGTLALPVRLATLTQAVAVALVTPTLGTLAITAGLEVLA